MRENVQAARECVRNRTRFVLVKKAKDRVMAPTYPKM